MAEMLMRHPGNPFNDTTGARWNSLRVPAKNAFNTTNGVALLNSLYDNVMHSYYSDFDDFRNWTWTMNITQQLSFYERIAYMYKRNENRTKFYYSDAVNVRKMEKYMHKNDRERFSSYVNFKTSALNPWPLANRTAENDHKGFQKQNMTWRDCVQ